MAGKVVMQRLPRCPVTQARTGLQGHAGGRLSRTGGRPAGLQLWALVGRTDCWASGNTLGGRSGLCHDSTKRPKEARGLELI